MVSSPIAPHLWWWCVVSMCATALGAWYDTFTGNQITEERVEDLRRNELLTWCAIEVADCSPDEPRRPDHTCNNIHYPTRGAFMTPFYRLLPPSYSSNGGPSIAKSGRDLPNARALRVSLIPDGRISNERFTNLFTNVNVFVMADVVSAHDTVNYVAVTKTCCAPGGDKDPKCIPIPVARDDVHLRRSPVRCLNLTRAITYQRLGCVPTSLPGERINTVAPMLDLSQVYGTEAPRALAIRELKGGRLKVEILKGKEWPPGNGAVCLNNEGAERRCHDAGEGAVNSLIGINLSYIWFFRQHNAIAAKLAAVNPCWDDQRLYTAAREINTAIYQQILYYELMVNGLGYEYLVRNQVIFPGSGHVDDYDSSLEPRVSLEFVGSMRWFHTLQEGRLSLYDRRGKVYDQLAAVDMTLRTGRLVFNNTLEGLTQGCIRQACASGDYAVDPDLGERSLGRLQMVSDVVSADIMKSRDVGLPSYNRYRKLCRLPVAKEFHDLYRWMSVRQVEALTLSYEDVDDIDLMAGILAELPMENSVMGPTLACIITLQLQRWRRADRFWFENRAHPDAFTTGQLQQIRKMTIAKVICEHGDSVDAVQPNAFQLPGYGNEFIPCSEYPQIDYEAWRDYSCVVKEGNTQLYAFNRYNELQNKEIDANNTQLYSLRENFQELFEKLALKDNIYKNPGWIQWNKNNNAMSSAQLFYSPALNQFNQDNALNQNVQNSNPTLNQLNQNKAIVNNNPNLNQLNQNNAISNNNPTLNQLNQNNAFGNNSPNLNQLNQNNAILNNNPTLNQLNQNNAIGNNNPNLNQLNQNNAILNNNPTLNQLNQNNAIGNNNANINQLIQNNAISNNNPTLNQLNQNNAFGNNSPNLNQLNQNNAILNNNPTLNQLNQNNAIGNNNPNLNQLNQNNAIPNNIPTLNQLNQNNAFGKNNANINQLNQNNAILNNNPATNQLNQNNAITNSNPVTNQLNQNNAFGNNNANINQLNQNNAILNNNPATNQLNQNNAITNSNPVTNQLNQNNAQQNGNSVSYVNQLNQNNELLNNNPDIDQLKQNNGLLNKNPGLNKLNQNYADSYNNGGVALSPNDGELYYIAFVNQLNQENDLLNNNPNINQLNQNNAILNNNPTLNQNNVQQENNQTPNENNIQTSDNPALIQVNQNNAILNSDSNINQLNQNNAQTSNNQPIIELNQNNAILNNNSTINQLNQNSESVNNNTR